MFRTNKTPVLQTKSASGSVATFNTALAMPLASCNIAVNAWQEGSGDPSPSNVRAIHGFSEVNVTANNVVHTIQLGQEVYGAEVDVVNGVAHVTHKKLIINSNNSSSLRPWTTPLTPWVGFMFQDISMLTGRHYGLLINYLKSMATVADWNGYLLSKVLYLIFNEDVIGGRTLSDAISYVNEHPLEAVVPLATPFDIQLTPQQIETLIGNNTIFADTGDVDLTYKDLDIAKRGNFREVFKLPS